MREEWMEKISDIRLEDVRLADQNFISKDMLQGAKSSHEQVSDELLGDRGVQGCCGEIPG